MTTKKMSALLQEQTSVNTEDKELSTGQTENMAKYVRVDDSPFSCILLDGERWSIVMGDQIVYEETFDTLDDAMELINSKPWSLIMAAAYLYTEYINKNIEQLKNEEK